MVRGLQRSAIFRLRVGFHVPFIASSTSSVTRACKAHLSCGNLATCGVRFGWCYQSRTLHGSSPAGRASLAGLREKGLKIPLSTVNEAGFDVGVKMSPEEANALGIKPFGDGGAECTQAKPKIYTHGPCASVLGCDYIVKCAGIARGDSVNQSSVAKKALSILREHGFVVLESLLPIARLRALELEAECFLDRPQDGFVPQPLRAGRTEAHLPFRAPWNSDWLVGNDVILEVAAGYLRNHLAAGRTQEEQQWGLVQWLTSGAELDWFLQPEWGPKPGKLLENPPQGCSDVGSSRQGGAFFGRVSLIKTPSGSPPQKYHRDIVFPGPMAQLTVQVALTQLVANNGPLAYVPGSHRMKTPGFEVVATPPLGSVVLYDSFVEHRGIEHHGSSDRYALYYEFETRGVFTGYTDNHFGPESSNHIRQFRKAIDPGVRKWVELGAS